MTARPLFTLYRAFIGEMLNDKDAKVSNEERTAILGVLKTFDSDYQAAINTRNDYLHGTWFIGWGNAEAVDFSRIFFNRFKVKNEGLVPVPGPSSVEEIEPLIVECERLKDYFLRMHGCINWHSGPRVSKNFMLDPAGKKNRWIKKPPPS
jgi:hypothetical protein